MKLQSIMINSLLPFIVIFSINAQAKPLNKYKIYSPFIELIKKNTNPNIIEFDQHHHINENTAEVFSTLNQSEFENAIAYPHIVLSNMPGVPFKTITKNNPDGNYFNTDKTYLHLESLATQYADNAKVYNLNERYNIAKTMDGNVLKALKISKNPNTESSAPKVLFIGQHHARELMTHHSVMDIANDFLKALSKNKAWAVNALDKAEVWFVPVVNPDGLNFVFTEGRWWRKNRSINEDGSRGVDLNRNYEFGWGQCGSNSGNGNSDVYRGKEAFSEIETSVMDALNKEIQAQYVVSFHSYGDEVLFPYTCYGADMADQKLYHDLRDRLANHLGFGKRYASSSGEDFEHHFHRYGSLSFLLELGLEFQPSFKTYRKTVLPNVKKILPFLLEEFNHSFLKITTMDKSSRSIIPNVEISIDEMPVIQNERRQSNSRGVHFRKIDQGLSQLTIRAKKDGYREIHEVLSFDGRNLSITVELEK